MIMYINVLVFKTGLSYRFDLIFLMLDPQDEQFDRRLATHLVSLYHQTQADEETQHMVCMIIQLPWLQLWLIKYLYCVHYRTWQH